MPHLCIQLLGTFQVSVDNQPITDFESDKVRALLAFLAMESDRPHRREALAGMLWPDSTDRAARTNLRHVLSNLRQCLRDHDASPPFLRVDHQTLQFNSESDHTLDVARFRSLLDSPDSPNQPDQLAEAVSLYQGSFLGSFSLAGDAPFEEWALLTREHLTHQMLQALEDLVVHYEQTGAYQQGLPYAWQQVELDPLRENGYQQLMRMLALNDQRSLALVVYESCRRILAEELDAEPSQETMRLVTRIRDEDLGPKTSEQATSEGNSPPPLPHNLPIQLRPFVGREQAQTQVIERLTDPACRLLTLIGLGGSGKTRLAIEVGETLVKTGPDRLSIIDASFNQDLFPHGIWFVPLVAIHSPDQLIPSIAEALDFSFHNGYNPKIQLLDYLSQKNLLLILDNFEHLLDGATLLTDMLTAAPSIKILVTSREVLGLREAWLYFVEGLTFPPNGQCAEQDSGNRYEAVQLFAQCARQVEVGFDLSAERDNVAKICQLVEGLPLGIELAAGWLKIFSCPQIVQTLKQGLDLLATAHRDMPNRHRSIRTVFENTWQLLTNEEQRVLRQMAVFRGNFQATAARQVAGASLLMLVRFIEKSLVKPTANGRYHLHELLRQFAMEKLVLVPQEQTATKNRHSAYFLAYVSQREVALSGNQQQQALVEISESIENIRAGWCWALEEGQIATLEQAISGLHDFYYTRSRFKEGYDLFKAATARIQNQAILGKVLARYGAFSAALGNLEQARELLERSLTLVNKQGDTAETAFVLFTLGGIVKLQGNLNEAKQLCTQSLVLSQTAGHSRWRGIALNNLATIAQYLGDFQEAKRYHQESLAFSRSNGHQADMAYTLNRLGMAAFMLGQYKEAEGCFSESLCLAEAMSDRFEMSMALGGFGWISWAQGGANLAQAKAWFEQSLAICQEIGFRYHIGYRLGMLSRVSSALGENEAALKYAREALDIARQFKSPFGISFALNSLGRATGATGNVELARQHLQEALQVAMKAQAFPNANETLTYWAELLLMECNPSDDEPRKDALSILTVVCHHPASSHLIKQQADQLIAQVMTQLPPEICEIALAHGQAVNLPEMVAKLVATQSLS